MHAEVSPRLFNRREVIPIEVVRKSHGVRGFAVIPKRGIVERTFAWLGRSRRHGKDYERNPETSETFIRIAMTQLMLKRLLSSKT